MRLISVIHEVIAKHIQAVYECTPGIVFWEKDNHLANLFDINVFSGKSKIFRQSHSLASPVCKNLCGLHDMGSNPKKYIP